MAESALVRLLQEADLPAYKALRDELLASDPTAFTSDAAQELGKPARAYLPRLGLDQPEGGQFTLGAWHGAELLGSISCEREARTKVRHVGHLIGTMVRRSARGQGLGRALLAACIAQARQAQGLEMLILTVTASNSQAVDLYLQAGFIRYGTLPRAICVDGRYHDKDLMILAL